MARYGFIHDKLDIKFLILYFMARVAAPIDFPTLTELTVCDDGIGYFEFAEAVSELVESGHLTLEDGLYSITENGRENGAACESSLPYSVKRNCSAQLVKLNGILRRNAQVRAETEPRPEGGYSARMFLDDDGGNLFTLELFCGSQEQANRLADVAHDGLARAIRPVHTQMDGDTMFALATGRVGSDVNFVKLCAAAAEVTARAIANAILFSLDA